ncbi:MAG TPA: hypothetical protein VJM31_17925 [Vicinamibacterales bacterium]|nr:hypothetical protein [Vicinamibacterales bacterium]
MFGLIYPYGVVLQALALLHFVRRRPETYWLWIILMFGGVGALIYIAVEVLPDASLLRGTFQVFPRRKRIKQLEGLVLDNPSIGNYEELGDLYLDDAQFVRARECFDRVLAKAESVDPFYRRALCQLALNDFAAAAADLEQVMRRDPKYDYHRAAGLLAHALAKIGQPERADALFAETLQNSTLSETQYNYATFLSDRGRPGEAREWAERILRKKATMPDYIRRQERPWFRKGRALLKRLSRT